MKHLLYTLLFLPLIALGQTSGCMDEDACNYNADASSDDGSCIYGAENAFLNSIMDGYNLSSNNAFTYFQQGTVTADNTSMFVQGSSLFTQGTNLLFYASASILNTITSSLDDLFNYYDDNNDLYDCNGFIEYPEGCTNLEALNFDDEAINDDGSCIFEFNISFDTIPNLTNISATYNIYFMNLVLETSPIQVGDLIGAFYLIDGVLVNGGFVVFDGSTSIEITLIGDDITTLEIEGFSLGQEIIWIVQRAETKMNYLINTFSQADSYTPYTQEVVLLEEVNTSISLGCTDPTACNFNPEANFEDGSCAPVEYVDCSGECFNDIDMDGVCDEIDYDDGIGLNETKKGETHLLKMIDILGKEHKEHKRGMLLFYIYENGKVEKRLMH
jgi:hypothetical protein